MSVTTTADGVTLWWSAQGDGPPLLLIQGLGYTADMWFRALPLLAPNFRTIRFDNRGVGRSSVPPLPWALADFADDAAAVQDAAGVTSAAVIGLSMGGLIAQELALRHPDRVTSLVLAATHPGGRDAARMDPAAATMLKDRSPRSPRQVAESSVPFLYADSTPRDDINEDLSVRLRHPLRASAYWGQFDAMRHGEGTLDRLPRIGVPTLVVHGTSDRLVNPANAQLLADAIPGARLEWIEDAGHLLWTDATDRVNAVVQAFLAQAAAERLDQSSTR